MKKAILVFTIMLLLGALAVFGVMFTGCAPAEDVDIDETHYEYIPMHFNYVGETEILGYQVNIMMHMETGVLYLYDSGTVSGMTVLLNADGTPMTYDQFNK